MKYSRYIPEVLVRGCHVCPYFSKGHLTGEDECLKSNQWLNIIEDPNIPKNEWIDKDCPLPMKEII